MLNHVYGIVVSTSTVGADPRVCPIRTGEHTRTGEHIGSPLLMNLFDLIYIGLGLAVLPFQIRKISRETSWENYFWKRLYLHNGFSPSLYRSLGMDIPKENELAHGGSPSPQPSPQEGEGDHQKPKAFGYIWIHAVSVGEVLSVRSLVQKLETYSPRSYALSPVGKGEEGPFVGQTQNLGQPRGVAPTEYILNENGFSIRGSPSPQPSPQEREGGDRKPNALEYKIRLLITTTTPSGFKIAQKHFPHHQVLYTPLDFSFSVRSFLDRFSPQLVLFVEQEFWPNVLGELARRKIPALVLNTRLSTKSLSRYKRVPGFFRQVTRPIHIFCVPSSPTYQNLCTLGISPERLRLTGNLKMDALLQINTEPIFRKADSIRQTYFPSSFIVVAGSTHPGEEEILLKAFIQFEQSVRGNNQFLPKLILVPRHIRRKEEVFSLVTQRFSLSACFYSALATPHLVMASEGRTPRAEQPQEAGWLRDSVPRHDERDEPLRKGQNRAKAFDVLIVDTLGDLLTFYALSDVAFVGGSLLPKGGHNLLEPLLFRKPIFFGTSLFNVSDEAAQLRQQGIGFQVVSKEDVISLLKRFFTHPELAEKIKNQAAEFLKHCSPASDPIFALLQTFLNPKRSLYV